MNKKSEKRHLFSITRNDLVMQTFTVPGPGGGGKDTSRTGVRFIHEPSGAVGVGKSERRQDSNKREAFQNLAKDPRLSKWIKAKACGMMSASCALAETEEEIRNRVDRMITEALKNGDIVVEDVLEDAC